MRKTRTKAVHSRQARGFKQLFVQFPHQLHAGGGSRAGRDKQGTSPMRDRGGCAASGVRSGRLPTLQADTARPRFQQALLRFDRGRRPSDGRRTGRLRRDGATATVYLNQYEVPDSADFHLCLQRQQSRSTARQICRRRPGLAGFHIHLIEAGGTYGASGGEVTQDAFANPLGTTYNADGTVKVRGSGIILTDANGVALIQNLYPAKYTILVDPPRRLRLAPDLDDRRHAGHRCLGQEQRAELLPGIRPARAPRVRRFHEVRRTRTRCSDRQQHAHRPHRQHAPFASAGLYLFRRCAGDRMLGRA